jgi:hypothetical protein
MKIELLLYFLAARASNVTTAKKNPAEEVCIGRIRRRDLQGAGEQGKFHHRRGQTQHFSPPVVVLTTQHRLTN